MTLQLSFIVLTFDIVRYHNNHPNDLLDQMKKQHGLNVFRSLTFAVKSLGLILGLITVVAVSGCSKKETPASTTATQSVSNQSVASAAPIRTIEQPAAAQNQQSSGTAQATHTAAAPAGPDLAEINRTLIRWIVRNRRPPGSFDEFASSAGAPIPPAPAGKKYIIGGNMHVQLVNQ